MEHLKNLRLTWKEIKTERARRDLWQYANATIPKFFKEERTHLKTLLRALEDLYQGNLKKPDGTPYKKLMINMPPRHGKSLSLIKFTEWVLGDNSDNMIMTISYNEILASRFSKTVRNNIETESFSEDRIYFQDVFNARIKKGDAAASLWALEESHFSYLGGSFKGTITGLGCNIGIIDDPIKNQDEAYNELALQKIYDDYTNTFLSRLEEGAIQIINMTRWSENDLCGRLLDLEPDEWYVLKMEVYKDDKMLCEDLMSYKTYLDKKSKIATPIFQANYHQKPIDEEGKLYKGFKTYDELPEGRTLSYTDTADTGDDYLMTYIFIEYHDEAYIFDIQYTQASMETTEPDLARKLDYNGVNEAYIESNNGGRGFARNVNAKTNDMGNSLTVVKWFHQSKNKNARIYSNSAWVQEHVYFPRFWHNKWPELFLALSKYQRQGKNEHDDAPDGLTGVSEIINQDDQIKRAETVGKDVIVIL